MSLGTLTSHMECQGFSISATSDNAHSGRQLGWLKNWVTATHEGYLGCVLCAWFWLGMKKALAVAENEERISE